MTMMPIMMTTTVSGREASADSRLKLSALLTGEIAALLAFIVIIILPTTITTTTISIIIITIIWPGLAFGWRGLKDLKDWRVRF